jgi:SAM-dependent methyltransferase
VPADPINTPEMPTREEVLARHREVYDAMAPEYRERAPALEAVTLAALEPVIEELPPESRVLDVGCGAAVPTQILAARGHDAFAIDLSPRMVEMASSRISSATFLRGDYLETEFPERFRAIIAFAFIHLFPTRDAHAVLAKLRRDLDPDGLLLVGTTFEDVGREGFAPKLDYGKPLQRFRKVWTESEFEAAVRNAGFSRRDKRVHVDPFGKRWVDYVLSPSIKGPSSASNRNLD